ncbi:2-oxoglutarate and iron-dependent oxygenase JMJD4-like [Saccostrea echinata]|uniref:2-oxoglutarate and iron-dependent oxygenase JMJD4-like n=1 Tax=Saccostrea echinata TaxID=191078 RepID=UPI002A829BA9|nr:2-oxoglutarate and iron-dependent oxygenase JMJD4-like [Saccostrea echinata]
MAASMIINKLSSSVLDSSNTEKKKKVRDYSTIHVERVCGILTNQSYSEFFENYLLRNRPCILSSLNTDTWNSRTDWTLPNGQPNFEFLREKFGHACVPVANCKKEKYSSQPKEEQTFSNFLDYWQSYIESGHPDSMDNLYLKDWHFKREFPEYKAYETPRVFTSDWLNEFWDTKEDKDDYRFVYMGPKGSWTPFHADVFRSFSWSANICGKKKWIFYPPGEEENLCSKYGHLVYDVNSSDLDDVILYPNYTKVKSRLEIIQEAGEIIYVPSGWHHQVYNLEDTISINHNWLNGCNVDICWQYIKDNLVQVEREIEDCRGMEGWDQQCQLILKASCGIDYEEFLQFMEVIALNRIKLLQNQIKLMTNQSDIHQKVCEPDKTQGVNQGVLKEREQSTGTPKGNQSTSLTIDKGLPMDKGQINHCVFDLHSVKDILSDMICTSEFTSLAGCESRANKLILQIEKIINNFL